jgi:hypothetical protein
MKIVKVGQDEPPKAPEQKAGKTLKTYPRGVLKKSFKLKGVADPAKAPPLKKGMRKHTLRLLTEKGSRKYRKTLKKKIAGMHDSKVKDIVQKNVLEKAKCALGISFLVLFLFGHRASLLDEVVHQRWSVAGGSTLALRAKLLIKEEALKDGVAGE